MSQLPTIAAAGSVTVTFDTQFTDKLIPGLEKALTEGAARVAETARGLLGRNHGGTRSMPGQPPNSQTGDLSRRLIHLSPKQYGKPLTAAAGTNLVYGRVLEYGKVIRAKGKLLVIPLNRAAQRLLVEVGGKPRNAILGMRFRYGGARIARVKTREGGVLIGVVPKGKAKVRLGIGYKFLESAPIFLLSRKADIKPRPFMRPALHKTNVVDIVRTTARAEWVSKGLVT